MKIINNINEKIQDQTVICLGSFDGLHRGHKTLIENVINEAREEGLKSAVFTFSNHPASIIANREEPKLLISNDQKIDILDNLGVDYLIMIPFSTEFMKIEPENFVKNILVDNLNVKRVVVGFNYRFGYKGRGDTELLKKLGDEHDFKVEIVSPIKYKNEIISSTVIRNLISEGRIEKANNYLDRPFSIEGKVIHGKKRGKSMGFPTANIELNSNYIIPKLGVYKTETVYNSCKYKSITSVGKNPTFGVNEDISIETYILDFDENIYDKNIKINFIEHIRDEMKFESKEELIEQMNLDLRYALK